MYQNILVAVDGSPASRHALLEAARLAPPGASIRVVSVVENPMWSIPLEQGVVFDVELMHNALLKSARDIIAGGLDLLQAQGVEASTEVLDLFEHDNSLPGAILDAAAAWPADVIVLGTHGRRGIKRMLMGSVAEAVLREARLPVLLVHAPDAG
ncbi:MAG: hypothetical protein K0Q68_454 [Moraxellaceae bacterium]|jgi:nucleotide-binding universal stress UspA family protein|nr:hypothetical protein [Moraxellaceae bacterium]